MSGPFQKPNVLKLGSQANAKPILLFVVSVLHVV